MFSYLFEFFSEQVKTFWVIELKICDWIKIRDAHTKKILYIKGRIGFREFFFSYEHSSNKDHRKFHKCESKWLSSTVFLAFRAIERISKNQHVCSPSDVKILQPSYERVVLHWKCYLSTEGAANAYKKFIVQWMRVHWIVNIAFFKCTLDSYWSILVSLGDLWAMFESLVFSLKCVVLTTNNILI